MHEYIYFVYILANRKSGTLYTGMTRDLLLRANQHKTGVGSVFTKRYGVDRLVWYAQYTHVADAICAEKRIKRWRRAWKIALIEEYNPQWKDLLPGICGTEAA